MENSNPSSTVPGGLLAASAIIRSSSASMPLWEQTKIVTHRMNVALFRNTNYVNNKFSLHMDEERLKLVDDTGSDEDKVEDREHLQVQS
jgi:hypothetical protein